jgi:prepilin-type N-terminal cleavage/methylation domain-containing protein/prepilin-type processing-associated H-X9-DG protein
LIRSHKRLFADQEHGEHVLQVILTDRSMKTSYLLPRLTRRAAFTLIELLVVFAVIGIALGLLMAAVQRVREANHRASCQNNLLQIGLALHNYESTHGAFPPAAMTKPNTHGWTPFLLPFLEQSALFQQYRWDLSWFDPANQPVITTPLPVMQCPSVPGALTASGTIAGNAWSAAVSDYAPVRAVSSVLIDFGYIDPPADRAGVMRLDDRTRVTQVLDGTSNTVMVAEDAGRPQRWQLGQLISGEVSGGAGWGDAGNSFTLDGFNDTDNLLGGPCAINCTNDREVYSFHPGGATALFADGSVHFLTANIDIVLLAALVTRAGDETVAWTDY